MNDVIGTCDHAVVAVRNAQAWRWPLATVSMAWDDVMRAVRADPSPPLADRVPVLATEALALPGSQQVSRDAVRLWHSVVFALWGAGHPDDARTVATRRIADLRQRPASAGTTWALAVAELDAACTAAGFDRVWCRSQLERDQYGITTEFPSRIVERLSAADADRSERDWFRIFVANVEVIRRPGGRGDSWMRRLHEDTVVRLAGAASVRYLQDGRDIVMECLGRYWALPSTDPFAHVFTNFHAWRANCGRRESSKSRER